MGFFVLGVPMNYDKPFRTYTEQLDKLKNEYVLDISNKNFSLEALQTVSYYDLVNGYKDEYLDPSTNKFYDKVSMETLYYTHMFDKDLQSILVKHIAFIENYFKTTLAYVISQSFSVDENVYLDDTNYICKTHDTNPIYYSKLKKKLISTYTNTDYLANPTKYYKSNHNHIPAWILLKNVSFSNSINWYRLLKAPEKLEINNILIPGNQFTNSQKSELILNSLQTIRTFRNTSVHNLKFISHKSESQLPPKLLKKYIPPTLLTWKDINKNNCGIDDLYSCILSVILLLKPYLLLSQRFISDLLLFFYQGNGEIDPRFSNYARLTNLPMNLPHRLNIYISNI